MFENIDDVKGTLADLHGSDEPQSPREVLMRGALGMRKLVGFRCNFPVSCISQSKKKDSILEFKYHIDKKRDVNLPIF